MAERRRKQDGEGESANPLADIFPGETLAFRNGTTATVQEWGGRALRHEAPAILGRLMARIMPIGADLRNPDTLLIQLPYLMQHAMDDLVALCKLATGLEDAQIDALRGAELIQLFRAVLRQNRDFFVETAGLYADAAGLLTGFVSPPHSSEPASG